MAAANTTAPPRQASLSFSDVEAHTAALCGGSPRYLALKKRFKELSNSNNVVWIVTSNKARQIIIEMARALEVDATRVISVHANSRPKNFNPEPIPSAKSLKIQCIEQFVIGKEPPSYS